MICLKLKKMADCMSERSLSIKVKKIQGQKALILTSRLGILRKQLVIRKNANYLYLPIIRHPEKNELLELERAFSEFEISPLFFSKKKRSSRTLVQVLGDRLPSDLLASLPRAMDLVGDIAIVEIPPLLKVHEELIGKAILETHKNVRTVLAKTGAVSGTYRLRKLEIIAGEQRTFTLHKEYGCKYEVDVAKAYFSPRLSHEHNRIASLVRKGETIVDLFAGVGPFSILIAKRNVNTKIYAVDINPEAINLLKKNIRLNRVENRIFPILGDVEEVFEKRLLGIADRVIMNLPERAIEFIDIACRTIKPEGGVIHFYGFIRLPTSLENLQLRLYEAVKQAGRNIEDFLSKKNIRATAPYEWQIVLDVKIH